MCKVHSSCRRAEIYSRRGLAKHVAKLAAERAAAKAGNASFGGRIVSLLDASKHTEVKEKIQQTKDKAREKLETRCMSSVFFAGEQSCERECVSGSGCSVALCALIATGLGLW